MEPSLRRRISFSEFRQAATAIDEPSTLARTHAYLFAAGGTLVVVSLLLPHDPLMNEAGVLACAVLAFAVAAGAILGFDRIPRAVSRAIPAAGTVLISLTVYFEHSGVSPYPMLYAGVAVAAAQLSSRRWAAAHVGLVGVGFGLALLVTQAPEAAMQWIVVVGLAAMVAAVVLALRLRLEGLIRHLDEAARTDALTGLLNRRGFDSALELELERARRSGAEVGLLIGDLDSSRRLTTGWDTPPATQRSSA